MEPLSDGGEFSGVLDYLLGDDSAPEGAEGGDVGSGVPGDVLDELFVDLVYGDHALDTHGLIGFVEFESVVEDFLGVFFVVEFWELEVVLADELEESLEPEVELFGVAELLPVAEVHSVGVAGWDGVEESFLETSGGAGYFGFDLFNNSLSGVGGELGGIRIDGEGVG